MAERKRQEREEYPNHEENTSGLRQIREIAPLREPMPVCQGDLEDFFQYLEDRQRGNGTLESYQRTLLSLYDWLPEEKMISRPVLVRWKKETVSRGYAVRTVNAKISAVNSFLEYKDRRDLQLHPVSAPKNDVTPELSRREYLRLLKTARIMKRERTYFLSAAPASVSSSFPR